MTDDNSGRAVTRRTVLAAGVGVGGLTAATGVSAAQEIDYGGWFGNVSNFTGTVDRTGQDEVTVQVGVQANGGFFGFGPPAIHVDPGTTVTWEWTGRGGAHNVIATNDTYSSQLHSDAGATFSHTFENDQVSLYYCDPHRGVGMKGAVVVGDATSVDTGGPIWSPPPLFDTTFIGMLFGVLGVASLSVLGAEAYVRRRERLAALRPDEPVEETAEAESDDPVTAISHQDFDPVGTGALVVLYFLILLALWVFTYFIEFLGGGPSVVG